MDEFTPIDWIIAGIIFAIGLVGAVVKVFLYDDPEIRQYRNNKKNS